MSNTSIPKFHETFIPILKVLSDVGILHYKDLREKVRDTFFSDLPKDLLEKKTKSGDLLVLNRIGWGKAYLKQGLFVAQPKRGFVEITDKGLEQLAKGVLTFADLRKDPDYVAAEVEKGKAKLGETESYELESESPQDLIDYGFNKIEGEAKAELLRRLKNTDPYYFEKVILLLLNKMGYGDFIETKKSGDGGIDGIINEDKLGLDRIFIQAKRYSDNKVRETEIRNFIGAMSGDTGKGVFVTTSSFDDSAKRKAADAHHKIILIDGEALVELMYEYGVGVQVSNTYEIKQVDEDFFEDI